MTNLTNNTCNFIKFFLKTFLEKFFTLRNYFVMNKAHNLSIGHCNIQGGLLNLGKSNELTQLIRDHRLDILSLNETNLKETIHSSTINVPTAFDLIRCDRPNSSRGGSQWGSMLTFSKKVKSLKFI